MRRRPLFKRAMSRALGSSPEALNDHPQLLRMLIEVGSGAHLPAARACSPCGCA